MTRKEEISAWFQQLQNNICDSLESLDTKGRFREDVWKRPEGGGGRSRIMENGKVIEKGGVNFSAVSGPTPTKILQALKLEKANFFATGVSIVLHPINPWMPIIHMNVRYFEMSNGTYWFGGGIDLTPHYVTSDSGAFIHQQLKGVCDEADPAYYQRFKDWADDYFFIPHRNETRGVGGIFFDRLNETAENKPFSDLWAFVQKVGEAFIPIYTHYAKKHAQLPYEQQEIDWQRLRRGRYVEFNLVWDKGTKFGLDTNGRTESILMSMPPDSSWKYHHTPQSGSPEEETLKWLKKGIDWVNA
ncbi:MAG: oxygen-dependent coproporphyrinogen oxidase [Cyclobacteriaceae bacterium]